MGMMLDESGCSVSREELVYVRLVDISYSMGDGTIVQDYPDVGLVPYNLDFIRALTRTSTDNLFIATGHGDSMEPTLLRSDLLMIDTSQQRIAQQDLVWALSYAGAGMIKRVRRQRSVDGDELVILSDNPSVPAQVVPAEDVHVVGRLIWIGRKM
jgi:phage repressor protein C with HTH and peptisase S24 domain